MNAFPICRGNAPPPPAGGGGVAAGDGSVDIRFVMTKNYEGVQIADENKNRVTLTTPSTLPCRRQRLHSYEVDDYQPHAEFKGSEANNQQYEKDLCGVWKVRCEGPREKGIRAQRSRQTAKSRKKRGLLLL